MPTVRTLLDRYGQPPPEVALDWAWQVHQHAHITGDNHSLNQLASSAVSSASSSSCLLSPQSWTDLPVFDDGQLDCAELNAQLAQAALADLKLWATSANNSHAHNSQPVAGARPEPDLEQTEVSASVAIASRQKRELTRRSTKAGLVIQARYGWFVAAAAPVLIGAAWMILGTTDQSQLRTLTHAAPPKLAAETNSSENAFATAASEPAVESLELIQLPPADLSTSPDMTNAAGSGATAIGELKLDSSLSGSQADAGDPIASHPPSLSTTETPQSPSRPNEPAVGATASDPTDPATDPTPNLAADATGMASNVIEELQKQVQQVEKTAKVVEVTRNRDLPRNSQHEPWVLVRDTLRYRVTLPVQWQVDDLQSQWTLALEPVHGLAVEPKGPVKLSAKGLAVWRIYDPDAKPPRSNLVVRALHTGRDGRLDLVFCGTAEDFPGLSIPLAQRVLAPLTVQVQTQAVRLRTALSSLSTTVITPDLVPAAMQRKQALLGQLQHAARLGVVLPDVNRLTDLIDGQLTMHAELKGQPDEPPVASWGRILE